MTARNYKAIRLVSSLVAGDRSRKSQRQRFHRQVRRRAEASPWKVSTEDLRMVLYEDDPELGTPVLVNRLVSGWSPSEGQRIRFSKSYTSRRFWTFTGRGCRPETFEFGRDVRRCIVGPSFGPIIFFDQTLVSSAEIMAIIISGK